MKEMKQLGGESTLISFLRIAVVGASVLLVAVFAIFSVDQEQLPESGNTLHQSISSQHEIVLNRLQEFGEHLDEVKKNVEAKRAFSDKTYRDLWGMKGLDDYLISMIDGRSDCLKVSEQRSADAESTKQFSRPDQLGQAPTTRVTQPGIHSTTGLTEAGSVISDPLGGPIDIPKLPPWRRLTTGDVPDFSSPDIDP